MAKISSFIFLYYVIVLPTDFNKSQTIFQALLGKGYMTLLEELF